MGLQRDTERDPFAVRIHGEIRESLNRNTPPRCLRSAAGTATQFLSQSRVARRFCSFDDGRDSLGNLGRRWGFCVPR